MLILTIVTAAVCFITAAILFSPYFRKIPLLHPMAFYLIFIGAWQIFSFVVSEIDPASVIPSYVGKIGTVLILLYYLFILFMTRTKSKKKNRKDK